MNTPSVEAVPSVQARAAIGQPAWLWCAVAVTAFHVAYLVPALAFLMFFFLYALVRLAEVRSARQAFYGGFLVGVACYGPQLWFFWGIFRYVAGALWAVAGIWIGFFVLITWGLRQVPGIRRWAWAAALPAVWMGLEYFRCELYYLKFAWLTPGLAFGDTWLVSTLGVYGTGFVVAAAAALAACLPRFRHLWVAGLLLAILALLANVRPRIYETESARVQRVVGIQQEEASSTQIIDALDTAVSKYPDVALLVMSEYTLSSPPTAEIRAWCRRHERYLIIGGIQPLTPLPNGKEQWADTAFVIDPKGDIVFTQGKCVPIQFFDDGVPAKEQQLWQSPWGKVGICICYDLSYSRVTDELIRQGADILIVPTMDAISWGAYEHNLHARIAPARAAEYHVPIIRVASSGISQIICKNGTVSAPFPGQGAMLTAQPLGLSLGRARIPPDRHLAPVCVGLTALLAAGLLGRHYWPRRWRYSSRTEEKDGNRGTPPSVSSW